MIQENYSLLRMRDFLELMPVESLMKIGEFLLGQLVGSLQVLKSLQAMEPL